MTGRTKAVSEAGRVGELARRDEAVVIKRPACKCGRCVEKVARLSPRGLPGRHEVQRPAFVDAARRVGTRCHRSAAATANVPGSPTAVSPRRPGRNGRALPDSAGRERD